VAAARRQISAAGTCAPFEQELIRRDGSRVAVLVGGAATAETRDRGVSFVLDITERKRAEEQLRLAKEELENRVAERTAALREANVQLQQELGERQRVAAALELSRERFRRISELTSDYAYRFRIEADGKVFLEWHAGAFSRITGFAFEEIASLQRLNALIHPDDRAAVLERTVRLLAGESVTIAFRMRTKSGDYRWLQDYSQPEWDEVEGRVVRVLGATRDVTERRQAEEELRLSEERFALAAAGANDGVWDWNIDTGEVYLSPRWKDILGFADDEIRNEIEEWIARVHTDDREHVSAAVERHLRGETPHFRSEYRLQHKDGSYRWVLSRGVAVRRSGGRPYRMAGSLTDVTPRRQAEEEARRRQAELAQAQRLSTLGEMAAGMAHELNQPLAAIVSYARGCVYRMQAGDAQSAELLYAIEQVAKQALRAGEILQRYRGFVRLGVLRRDWVDLNKLAQEVAQFARAAAREERVAIRLDLASEMPPVLADSVQIEQVLMNLIRNALDAMQGCSGAEIWVRTSVRDEEVEIAVQDEGKGIPEADRDRIFETFFTTKPEGLGMGLSICRSIIDAHGGRLWASSGPGSGAIFRFTVPATNGIVAAVAGDAALAQNDQS
jgi:two-component system sensor kinase FixL